MKNKKILTIILVSAIIILMTFFITRRVYFMAYYSDTKLNFKFNDIGNKYKIKDEMKIETKQVSNDDYITIEDMRIRNDFKDYSREIVSSANGDMTIRYTSSNGSYFSIGITSPYLNLFNSIKEIESYLKNKKVNNDIDLIKLIASESNKSNFFKIANDLKGQYYLYLKASEFDIQNITLINGSYTGFMSQAIDNVREINLYKNNKRYVLLFVGNDFTLDKIQDLLNTVNIA